MKLFEDDGTREQGLAQLKLTAVGGCGLTLLDQLHELLGDSVSTLGIDTDRGRLFESECNQRLLLGEEFTGGDGTGGDDKLGERCLSGNNMQVRDLISGVKANLIIGGLGGGTATALMPEVSKISRSTGALTLVVATRPFGYEEESKSILAKRKIHSLVRSADSVFLLGNDALAGVGKGKMAAREALRRADASLIETVCGILEFLTPRKRLLLDFGTVKSHLSRGGLSAFAFGVSAMRNNAIDALKTAMERFAKMKSDITKAPRALVQFAIDDDVLMDGVRNAYGVAQRVFSKDAQLALGVVFNGVKQGKTHVSMIASGLPLFNEVVELDFLQKQLKESENPAMRLRTGGGTEIQRRKKLSSTPGITVLNPRGLSEDELKIPAYLRRRMLFKEKRT
jgi:cell division protein FtsZ